MTSPEARQTEGEPPTSILPLMKGNIRGEDFVVSADMQATALYVQFEGWVVEYDVTEMLEESFAEVWGPTPDEYDIDLDLDGDSNDG